MASCFLHISLTVLFLALSGGPKFTECTNLTIINRCKETIWPAITPADNFTNGGGFTLKKGESAILQAPPGWHGRIWARTGCNFDNKGNGTCQTGRCGTSLKCSGPGQSPATLVEFTIAQQENALDFYDVSLVTGFNVPVVVTPLRSKGNCSIAGCDTDLRNSCPSELAVTAEGKTIACQSACDAFRTDEYCCRGTYGNPGSCKSTNYSTIFKAACPVAYSYAFDDPTSIKTCSASDYVLAFCASRNQTVCTYHDQKLVCNGLRGTKAFPHVWWILMLTLSSLFG
ncbi:hypothetical protein Ancab_026882 [Ancistrocladus abbreviatus]